MSSGHNKTQITKYCKPFTFTIRCFIPRNNNTT